AKWANCKLNLGDFIQLDEGRTNTEFRLFNMENERNWGWAFGMTLLGDRKWTLTGEVRFVDETAAHVNTQFRF
ncbi:MAG: hypothetical protein K0U13_06450, partial [Chlamydiae bacterium]|nr:hypothetical protein [Chlamydiota bacterium]